jgi:polar amino acid transport system substrate-binding protein
MSSSQCLAALLTGALVASFVPDFARGAVTADGAHPPLRVITIATAPFVLPRTDPPVGFSIDLWNEVARRMRVDFTWQIARDPAQLLAAVQSHDADVAIGAIAVTPESEQIVDFSVPYFDSGLRIMVRSQYESGVIGILRSIPWAAIGYLFAVATFIIFLLANVLWLIERRGRELPGGYLAAIGEELWGAMLVIATLNVDRDAPGSKRVTILLMWLVGVVLIAQLTATVTSTQTIARMQSMIRGPEDLPGKTIASVPRTDAGNYLAERGLPFTTVTYGPDGIRMLARGEVQAVVFDAATLQYWAAKQGKGLVQVVGPIFRPQKYAIAVPVGSALRKQMNRALLEIYADGTYERIYSAWFSVAQ